MKYNIVIVLSLEDGWKPQGSFCIDYASSIENKNLFNH